MSQRQKLQDASGILEYTDGILTTKKIVSSAPAGGEVNYQVGAMWINKGGSAGNIIFFNVGTTSSATWLNVA